MTFTLICTRETLWKVKGQDEFLPTTYIVPEKVMFSAGCPQGEVRIHDALGQTGRRSPLSGKKDKLKRSAPFLKGRTRWGVPLLLNHLPSRSPKNFYFQIFCSIFFFFSLQKVFSPEQKVIQTIWTKVHGGRFWRTYWLLCLPVSLYLFISLSG